MKRIFTILVALVMVLGLTVTAQALLIDNSDGTITQTRIDDSRLMWLQDTNAAQTSGFDADGLMTWAQANDWIDSLNNDNYLGYKDWRLPEVLPGNGISYNYQFTNDGSSDKGYNISGLHSEMGYMYYTELGFLGYCSPSDPFPCTPEQAQPGFGWKETDLDLFENLTGRPFWAGPLYAPTTPERQWVFAFNNGY